MPTHYFSPAANNPAQLIEFTARINGTAQKLYSVPGIFSATHIDQGTNVLLDKAPRPPATGTFLDLGCGWGPIALHLADTSPAAKIWAVDINPHALAACAANATKLGAQITASTPENLPTETTFDLIWSNPPIRIGKPALHTLLSTWLPRLRPKGKAYLVVQKHLGSDSLQKWLTATFNSKHPHAHLQVWREASAKGFRVLGVEKL